MGRLLAVFLAISFVATGSAAALAADPASKADRALDRALQRLVTSKVGPPGALVVIQRRNRIKVHRAGVTNLRTGGPLRARNQMRIASVSKAFSAATALSLVDQGVLSLDDTIGARLPELPKDWHPVTLRQLLAHTSGLPDFTASPAFAQSVGASPASAPPPRQLLAFVEGEPLNFPPGSDYSYSNSDNIAVGLMVEAVTGTPYEQALRGKVLGPHRLGRTRMAAGVLLPNPFIRGYAPGASGSLEDVSQVIAFGGWAWASGGLVSTPRNANRFVRAYVGGRLFGAGVQREQYRLFPGGSSKPRGPGQNAAGLGVFRYRTRCGTVFGHTGSILGYTQLIAASKGGRRSLTFTITNQVSDETLPELRKAQVRAVCAALARR